LIPLLARRRAILAGSQLCRIARDFTQAVPRAWLDNTPSVGGSDPDCSTA
jgi:hypothetical protein